MNTTQKIIGGVLIAVIAFFIGRCLNEKPALNTEEEFLRKYALIEGEYMVQTATRFFKDAAIQRLYLDTLSKLSSELKSKYSLNNCERDSLSSLVGIYGSIDHQYISRLGAIEKKKKLERGSSYKKAAPSLLLFATPPPEVDPPPFKPCPCPPSDVENAEVYCKWKEENFLPIIVDTSIWEVDEILIEELDTTHVFVSRIASSKPEVESVTTVAGSTYKLYKLIKDDPDKEIPAGSLVNFVVKWIDGNGDQQVTNMVLEVDAEAGPQGN